MTAHALLTPLTPRANLLGSWKRLAKRTDGAVMVVGLLFACFLASALWYVIGIGDTVVYRDRMQEAADAMAFSAGEVHARGMNFIVICNLIMFVLTALYTVLAVMTDLLETIQFFVGLPGCKTAPEVASCTFTHDFLICPAAEDAALHLKSSCCEAPCSKALFGIPIVSWVLSKVCCAAASFVAPMEKTIAEKFFPKYFKLFQEVMPDVEKAEKLTAQWLAPWGAEAIAYETATRYDQKGMMLSMSLIPDNALGNISGLHAPRGTDDKFEFKMQKIGLPVYSLRFRAECSKVVTYPFTWIMSSIDLPGPIKSIVNMALGFLGGVFVNHYCSTGVKNELMVGGVPFWYAEGPESVYLPAENGNDWMQVWSFVFGNKADTERNIVGLASHKPSQAVNDTPLPTTQWYSAESEFYFDCDQAWTDDECNGSGSAFGAVGGFAMYVPHWRTRLRRVHHPSLFADLISTGVAGLTTGGNQRVLSSGIQNVVQNITGQLTGLSSLALSGLANAAVTEGTQLITVAGTRIGSEIDPTGVISTTIH